MKQGKIACIVLSDSSSNIMKILFIIYIPEILSVIFFLFILIYLQIIWV